MKNRPVRSAKRKAVKKYTPRKDELKNLADFTSKNPRPSLCIGKGGTLLYANAASLPIISDWGKKIGDMVSREWGELIKEVLVSGIRENVEVECSGRTYSFVMVPVKKASYVNMYGSDVTERKRAMERLTAAYAQLQEAQSQLVRAEKMNVIGTLASGIAHEVKNPLATISQGLEYLSKNINSKDENVNSILNYMEDAVKKADGTIRGLLDFSRATALDIKSENLNSVIEESLSLIKMQSEKSKTTVVQDLDKNIPQIEIDKSRMQQVFVNLFLNSIQAMPDGGELKVKTYLRKLVKRSVIGVASPGVESAIEIEEKSIIAEIVDTGKGIPKGIADKIFEPFFTTRQGKGGTGLGLSIVRNILEMHEAGIEIKNKEGGGVRTTVIFKL
ncbi:MAG: hypothetical protein HQ549_02900 [Candidatus Omnitrophica bacterium]|nr:hypothetical protein [Candidatus Omnitrophota bacterium]